MERARFLASQQKMMFHSQQRTTASRPAASPPPDKQPLSKDNLPQTLGPIVRTRLVPRAKPPDDVPLHLPSVPSKRAREDSDCKEPDKSKVQKMSFGAVSRDSPSLFIRKKAAVR